MLAAMTEVPRSTALPWPRRQAQRLQGRWQGLSDHAQVGVCLAGMGGALALWGVFWPVPTEVVGQGVLLYPDNAGVLNARAAGQVQVVQVEVGQTVRRGQVLMRLYLPVLEKQLQQQRGNLAQLQRINRDLDQRDRLRLDTEKLAVETALAKLADDSQRYRALQATFASKLRNLEWLSRREVVAPLSSEVVTAEQGLTSTSVDLDQVKINQRQVVTAYQQVKLQIETQALQRRYQIDDLRRQLRITEARIAYDGQVVAERDGQVLDLQVIPGETVAHGQRLGTIGRPQQPADGDGALRAVAYFAPADARRLPVGLPVEVVPLWNQRGRFGGIVGRVTQVLSLPATLQDVSTTTGNPQLASELTKNGPVLRAEIALERDARSRDGYRWTLSGGSGVFPVREGLTVASHAYVEWRTPLSYVLPGLRSLTGGYRSLRIDNLWNRRSLRQPGTLP
jgi:HlyD family secretion protein